MNRRKLWIVRLHTGDATVMRKSLVMLVCVVAILLARLPAYAGSSSDSSVRAGTPEGAKVISRLERGQRIDQLNAQGYTGGDYRNIGLFYHHKAQEIDDILKKLRQGEAVLLDDVQKALDNSGANRFGAIY
jgi:hypothetical protein